MLFFGYGTRIDETLVSRSNHPAQPNKGYLKPPVPIGTQSIKKRIISGRESAMKVVELEAEAGEKFEWHIEGIVARRDFGGGSADTCTQI